MTFVPAVRDVWTKHPGYMLAWGVNVLMALYLGVTGLTMPGRFGAATFTPLRESLGVGGWGAALAFYGVLLIVCIWLSAPSILAAFLLGSVGYLLLGIWFAVGMADPTASPWGPIFVFIGVWQLTQWIAYRQAAHDLAARHGDPS